MDINWDSASVVDDLYRTIFHQSHIYFGAISSQRFINCVIDDFIDEVVEPALTGGADIHTWAFADSGETLKDGDRTGVVAAVFLAQENSF
jgi:hypothetical protein